MPGWAIRFYEANDYSEASTINIISNVNWEGDGSARELDNIVVFNSMFGVDNYFLWTIHENLPHYDFSSVAVNLKLWVNDRSEPYFQDFYRILSIRYDPDSSQFVVYGISEGCLLLHKRLFQFDVQALPYKENRKAQDVVKEVIEDHNIFAVVYHEDNESCKGMVNYDYNYFTFDLDWTVLDFIRYMANENQWEWCIDKMIDENNTPHYTLHIGHELTPFLYRNATIEDNSEINKEIASLYGMKIVTKGSPMEVLSHFNEEYRCMWSKHTAGKGGDISRGYFAPIGNGHYPRQLFYQSLEGNIERSISSFLLEEQRISLPSVSIASILIDEAVKKNEQSGRVTETLPYISSVSLEKHPDRFTLLQPHNVNMNRGDKYKLQHVIEQVSRSTPYLDNKAGLLFPSNQLEDEETKEKYEPPNSILFNVDGKVSSAVIGPYIYGHGQNDQGSKLLIPVKDKYDFRLKFQDQAEIFYNNTTKIWNLESENGFMFKAVAATPYNYVPSHHRGYPVTPDTPYTSLQMVQNTLTYEGKFSFMKIESGGCFKLSPLIDAAENQDYGMYEINCYNDAGVIEIFGQNKVSMHTYATGTSGEISIGTYTKGGEVQSGTVNVKTNGTVNIGLTSQHVYAGGSSHALSHDTHTHSVSPAKDIFNCPLIGDTAATTDNTSILKSD
jgi:hypothetical protein